jgi:hypothetical protein
MARTIRGGILKRERNMLKLNGFKWLFALAVLGGTANADIIIDNQSIPGSDINSISISPATGNLFVTTTPGYTVTRVVVGDQVAITNFTVSPGTILAGGSATLSWTTANAVSCTASNGVGGWAGSTIALPSGSKSITTSTLGSHQFTLSCNGSESGDTATSNVVLNVNPANAVAITSFTASPSEIDEGGSTTLSWTTQNASSCTASGGTGGWSGLNIGLPSGSANITIDTAGNYTFTLTCSDASGGQDSVSSLVIVNAEPFGLCDTPSLTGNVDSWKSFWLQDWPKPSYDNRYATIPRYGYLAIEFNTGNIVSKGRISTIETTVTDGVRLGAISQCPGDFNVAPECDYYWGIGGGIYWATDNTSNYCQLAPNTTYYLNLTYTNGVDSATTTCGSSPCITTIQNVNR